MEKRTQHEGRKFFWIGQRKKILRKTNGHCAHCGIKLQLKDMSPDHAVPLSKGGTNELKNIIPLCESCNKRKRNYILDPKEWCRYMKEDSLNEVEDYYEWYLKEYKYITFKNFTKEDVFRPKGANRKERRSKKSNSVVNLIVKVDDRDYDKIKDFFVKYSKKISGSQADIEEDLLRGFLKENGVYAIKTGNEYSALLAIRIGSPDVGLICPVFFIYSLYKKYASELLDLADTVMQNLYFDSKDSRNLEYSVALMLSKNDPIKKDLETAISIHNSENKIKYTTEKYNRFVNVYIKRGLMNETPGKGVTNCFVENFGKELEKDCVPEIKHYSKLVTKKNTPFNVLKIKLSIFLESLKICLSLEKLRKKRFSFANAIVYNIYKKDYWEDEVITYRLNVFKVCCVISFIILWFITTGYFISRLAFKF